MDEALNSNSPTPLQSTTMNERNALIVELFLSLPAEIQAAIYAQAKVNADAGDEIAQGWLSNYGDLGAHQFS